MNSHAKRKSTSLKSKTKRSCMNLKMLARGGPRISDSSSKSGNTAALSISSSLEEDLRMLEEINQPRKRTPFFTVKKPEYRKSLIERAVGIENTNGTNKLVSSTPYNGLRRFSPTSNNFSPIRKQTSSTDEDEAAEDLIAREVTLTKDGLSKDCLTSNLKNVSRKLDYSTEGLPELNHSHTLVQNCNLISKQNISIGEQEEIIEAMKLSKVGLKNYDNEAPVHSQNIQESSYIDIREESGSKDAHDNERPHETLLNGLSRNDLQCESHQMVTQIKEKQNSKLLPTLVEKNSEPVEINPDNLMRSDVFKLFCSFLQTVGKTQPNLVLHHNRSTATDVDKISVGINTDTVLDSKRDNTSNKGPVPNKVNILQNYLLSNDPTEDNGNLFENKNQASDSTKTSFESISVSDEAHGEKSNQLSLTARREPWRLNSLFLQKLSSLNCEIPSVTAPLATITKNTAGPKGLKSYTQRADRISKATDKICTLYGFDSDDNDDDTVLSAMTTRSTSKKRLSNKLLKSSKSKISRSEDEWDGSKLEKIVHSLKINKTRSNTKEVASVKNKLQSKTNVRAELFPVKSKFNPKRTSSKSLAKSITMQPSTATEASPRTSAFLDDRAESSANIGSSTGISSSKRSKSTYEFSSDPPPLVAVVAPESFRDPPNPIGPAGSLSASERPKASTKTAHIEVISGDISEKRGPLDVSTNKMMPAKRPRGRPRITASVQGIAINSSSSDNTEKVVKTKAKIAVVEGVRRSGRERRATVKDEQWMAAYPHFQKELENPLNRKNNTARENTTIKQTTFRKPRRRTTKRPTGTIEQISTVTIPETCGDSLQKSKMDVKENLTSDNSRVGVAGSSKENLPKTGRVRGKRKKSTQQVDQTPNPRQNKSKKTLIATERMKEPNAQNNKELLMEAAEMIDYPNGNDANPIHEDESNRHPLISEQQQQINLEGQDSGYSSKTSKTKGKRGNASASKNSITTRSAESSKMLYSSLNLPPPAQPNGSEVQTPQPETVLESNFGSEIDLLPFTCHKKGTNIEVMQWRNVDGMRIGSVCCEDSDIDMEAVVNAPTTFLVSNGNVDVMLSVPKGSSVSLPKGARMKFKKQKGTQYSFFNILDC